MSKLIKAIGLVLVSGTLSISSLAMAENLVIKATSPAASNANQSLAALIDAYIEASTPAEKLLARQNLIAAVYAEVEANPNDAGRITTRAISADPGLAAQITAAAKKAAPDQSNAITFESNSRLRFIGVKRISANHQEVILQTCLPDFFKQTNNYIWHPTNT